LVTSKGEALIVAMPPRQTCNNLWSTIQPLTKNSSYRVLACFVALSRDKGSDTNEIRPIKCVFSGANSAAVIDNVLLRGSGATLLTP